MKPSRASRKAAKGRRRVERRGRRPGTPGGRGLDRSLDGRTHSVQSLENSASGSKANEPRTPPDPFEAKRLKTAKVNLPAIDQMFHYERKGDVGGLITPEQFRAGVRLVRLHGRAMGKARPSTSRMSDWVGSGSIADGPRGDTEVLNDWRPVDEALLAAGKDVHKMTLDIVVYERLDLLTPPCPDRLTNLALVRRGLSALARKFGYT